MENFVVSTSKKFALEQFVSQVKVITPNAVKKIVSVCAKSQGVACDLVAKTATLQGKMKLEVVYLSADDVIECATAEADFIEKQKFEPILGSVVAIDTLSAAEEGHSANEVLCSVRHNTQIFGIHAADVPNFAADENVIQNAKEYRLPKLVCAAEDVFNVAEENESNLKNVQILKVNSQAVIDDVKASVDKVVVEGRVLSEILYAENNQLCQTFKQVDFKQEILAEKCTPDMTATAVAEVRNWAASVEDGTEKSILSQNFEVFVKVYVFEQQSISVASDLFALTNDLNMVFDTVSADSNLEMVEASESVLSQTDIVSIEDFDDMLGVYEPKICLKNIENMGDKAEILATVSAWALYNSAAGVSTLGIVSDVKFEVLKTAESRVKDAFLTAEIVSAKVKAGKEIEVVFKTNCHATLAEETELCFVKSYELAAEKPEDEGGIKVYVSRGGQTAFDVAKALNVRPEVVANQNEVEDVFEVGQKVYVYSPINFA